jgi:AraC family transcriptional regulator of adaptative response / DNA-3-methyladenine glycosylase II
MRLDDDLCYHRLEARDARFDGVFFVGVTSTRIYCRPICPARTPRRDRCRFFANAAAAEAEGFRPCLRCRPELAPGSAPVDAVARVAASAVARIEAGALNDGSFDDLAGELGLSGRQLRRAVEREYGVAPVQLAQTQRLLMAKRLLTDTSLAIADIAFASGFSSLRRFNHSFRTRYRLAPSQLRRQSGSGGGGAADVDAITLRLSYRPPLHWEALAGFLAGRGAAGVEAFEGGRYVRALTFRGRSGWLALEPLSSEPALRFTVSASLLPVLTPLLARVRALLDLDANPVSVDTHLSADARLRTLVARSRGLRVPGTLDGFELALRAVLGQQVSVRAATTLFGRFADAFGTPIAVAQHAALTRSGPDPARVAEASLDRVAALGLPRTRALTVKALARAVASGELRLEPGVDSARAIAQLCELPGIGDWTAQYVAMRALRDADAFPASDLGVLRALGVTRARDAIAIAESWRPWRAYAVMHLWRQAAAGG